MTERFDAPKDLRAVILCKGCGKEKARSEFGFFARARSGIRSPCRECRAAKDRSRRAAMTEIERAAYLERERKNALKRYHDPIKGLKIKDKDRRYAKANPERIKEARDKYARSKKGQEAKERHKARQEMERLAVDANYIRRKIWAETGLKFRDIPDALVEAIQVNIKIKRLVWGRKLT